MITGPQIRAARALLGWSGTELAAKCGLTLRTIQNVERGDTTPKPDTLQRVEAVFFSESIEFTGNDGVHRLPRDIEVFEGQERFNAFAGYLHDYLDKHGGELCIFVTDERILQRYYRNIGAYRETMKAWAASGKISGRILASRGNFERTWADLRRVPNAENMPQASFYVFGNNFALISFDQSPPPHVVLLKQSPFAAVYMQTFNAAWEKAEAI